MENLRINEKSIQVYTPHFPYYKLMDIKHKFKDKKQTDDSSIKARTHS